MGESDDANLALRRLARVPETPVTRNSPWLRSELAVAITPPGPISIVWDTADATLPIGGSYPAKVRVTRAPGVMGQIRLALLTSQQVPRLPDGREDTNRAIRIEGAPTIPGEKSDGTATVMVPANLAAQRYHVALRAELLASDGRTVIASAVTPSRRLSAVKPPPPPPPTPKPKK